MKRVALLAASLLLGTSLAAQTFVGTRAGLGANGLLDWGTLGAVNSLVANPTAGIAIGGLSTVTATLSKQSAGPFERRNQGLGWGGNFDNGDRLIWTKDGSGFLRIEFSSAVQAVGANINVNNFGSFRGVLRIFDGATLLQSFVRDGSVTFAGDGSALFLGATAASITAVEFGIGTAETFAINQLSVLAPETVVPEPSTYVLMATGLAFVGGIARRRPVRA